jgi:mevalonate kinase
MISEQIDFEFNNTEGLTLAVYLALSATDEDEAAVYIQKANALLVSLGISQDQLKECKKQALDWFRKDREVAQ